MVLTPLIGFYWMTKGGRTDRLEIMANAKGYSLVRFKGCMVFVLSDKEFTDYFRKGVIREKKDPSRGK